MSLDVRSSLSSWTEQTVALSHSISSNKCSINIFNFRHFDEEKSKLFDTLRVQRTWFALFRKEKKSMRICAVLFTTVFSFVIGWELRKRRKCVASWWRERSINILLECRIIRSSIRLYKDWFSLFKTILFYIWRREKHERWLIRKRECSIDFQVNIECFSRFD